MNNEKEREIRELMVIRNLKLWIGGGVEKDSLEMSLPLESFCQSIDKDDKNDEEEEELREMMIFLITDGNQ